MRKIKILIWIFLCACIIFSSVNYVVYAEESTDNHNNELLDSNDLVNDEGSLPKKYDSRDYGYITEVKNQGKFDMCWSFAAISAAESEAIIDGRDRNPDYSEAQLAWFVYNHATDPLGGTVDDRAEILNGDNFLTAGGNNHRTTMCFASWVAPAKESVARYDNAEYITKIDDKYGYKACKAHLQNAYWIPMNERYNIKRMIQKHGCVTAGILYYPYDYMEKKSVNGKMDCYFYKIST